MQEYKFTSPGLIREEFDLSDKDFVAAATSESTSASTPKKKSSRLNASLIIMRRIEPHRWTRQAEMGRQKWVKHCEQQPFREYIWIQTNGASSTIYVIYI